MPKSKRAQKVSLTETRKRGLGLKKKIVDEVQEHVDTYARIFIFSAQNMRNVKLKDLRLQWKHSRFHFGKNKVLATALGHDEADEYKQNLHKISRRLYGQMGLLFTNETKDNVVKFFSSYSERDYARSGNIATQTVVIDAGPLLAFSHSMDPQLRQLGLPTSLQKGVITLADDFKVCEKGKTLTPEQARLLKLFGHQMADFKISIESMWQNDGTFEVFDVSAITPFDAGRVRIKRRSRGPAETDAPDDEMAFQAVIDSEEEDEDQLHTGESVNDVLSKNVVSKKIQASQKAKSKDSGLDEPSSEDEDDDLDDLDDESDDN